MIAELDVPTLAFVASLVFSSVTIILLLVYRTRRVYAGFGYWLLWQIFATAGVLVFALRGADPSSSALVLTQVLLLTAPALLYDGMTRFYGIYATRGPALANYGLVAVALAAQAYFSIASPDVDARIAVYSLTRAVIMARCAIEPLRSAAASRSLSYWALVVVMAAIVVNDLHHAWVALQPGPAPLPSDSDSVRRALVTAVAADVLAAYILVLLNSERLEGELRSAWRDIETLARTDSLTEVWNRRHFEEVAATEIARAQRYRTPLALLALDADHFKHINDEHGHHTGDVVLRELAQLIGAQIRRSDLLCRWGGEEFLVLAPGTDAEQAAAMAEKIRRAIAGHRFVTVGTVTVSVGVGQFDRDETMESWLQRVDTSLYDAKQRGRNRVATAAVPELAAG